MSLPYILLTLAILLFVLWPLLGAAFDLIERDCGMDTPEDTQTRCDAQQARVMGYFDAADEQVQRLTESTTWDGQTERRSFRAKRKAA